MISGPPMEKRRWEQSARHTVAGWQAALGDRPQMPCPSRSCVDDPSVPTGMVQNRPGQGNTLRREVPSGSKRNIMTPQQLRRTNVLMFTAESVTLALPTPPQSWQAAWQAPPTLKPQVPYQAERVPTGLPTTSTTTSPTGLRRRGRGGRTQPAVSLNVPDHRDRWAS